MSNRTLNTLAASLVLLTAAPIVAQEGDEAPRFDSVTQQFASELRAAEAELTAVRERATQELLPLSRTYTELQKELLQAQNELGEVTRDLNADALALSNLTKDIEARRATATRLTNLFSEYGRNFQSRLHIAEHQRYADAVQEALLAPENTNLSPSEVYDAQSKVVELSLERIAALGGGARFAGTAVDGDGIIRKGTFALLGPNAVFRSDDGSVVGTAVQRVGSLEPNVQPFLLPEDAEAARAVVAQGSGAYPFDATLGNAAKVEATQETFIEHVQNGGPIMYPLLGMGLLAMFVALCKWLHLMTIRSVSRKKLNALLEAVRDGDEDGAKRRAQEMKGPVGEMLRSGVAAMRRSRDLMEEVMFERVLIAKERAGSFLPFVAICAAAAPLLGLLGTVTGIINTFAQITIYGSGDVKQLSGGISEALITTKFGLIVAIPSLLLHAYLARKARGLTTKMEAAAVRFANEVAASDEFGEDSLQRRVVVAAGPGSTTPEHELVRGQVNAILTDMLGPLANDGKLATAAGGSTAND